MIVRHAHGYVRADAVRPRLGRASACRCSPALAWVLTAARTLGMRRARPRAAVRRRAGRRCGRWPSVVVIFGVHSAIDWTWFVPGNVVPALLLAGWVAGRGPLRARLAAPPAPPEPRRRAPRAAEPPRSRWRPLAPAAGAAACSPRWRSPPRCVAAWAAYQPVRSVHAGDAALERLDQRRLRAGRRDRRRSPSTATRSPSTRCSSSPRSSRRRGQTPEAKAALMRATEVQPANAETWRRLGQFRLDALAEPRAALKDFQAAYYLDPQNPRSWSDLIVATRAVQADGG